MAGREGGGKGRSGRLSFGGHRHMKTPGPAGLRPASSGAEYRAGPLGACEASIRCGRAHRGLRAPGSKGSKPSRHASAWAEGSVAPKTGAEHCAAPIGACERPIRLLTIF